MEFRLKYGQETEKIKVSIGGSYNASNALAAIAAALALDIPMKYIRSGLAHVKVAGRMELYHMNHKDVDVIVDYAHNKLSYMTLFENIRKLYPDRKILLVFGCHGDKAYNRRKDLGQLANIYADKIILTEQDPGTESVADICDQVRRYIDDDKLLAVITDRGEAIAPIESVDERIKTYDANEKVCFAAFVALYAELVPDEGYKDIVTYPAEYILRYWDKHSPDYQRGIFDDGTPYDIEYFQWFVPLSLIHI